jgi:hypothetical protein
MAENQTVKENKLDNIAMVLTNKRTRSLVFLVITFILILMANGLLPLISGQAHYTADIREVTYGEYLILKEQDQLVDLTYGAKLQILTYQELYKIQNPDLTAAEVISIEIPHNLKITVYTKFFFESAWWYFDTGMSLISAVFLFYALFNYMIIRSKDTRIEHVNGEHIIKQLNENYLDPDTFEPWIDDVFNKERKIKQHIRNTKYDLKQLEIDTPFYVRRRFKNHFKDVKEVPENNLLPVVYQPLTKQERKYLDKKEEILSKLHEDYIREYVVDTNVLNFKSIKAGFVYSGVNHEGIGQDEYSSIQTDRQRVKGSIFSKILISLAVTLGFASVLTILAINVSQQAPLWIFLTILMKIVPLFLQFYFAIDYNNWFMENQLLPNLKFRENIAMLYLAEMRRQGKLTEPITLNKIELVQNRKKE